MSEADGERYLLGGFPLNFLLAEPLWRELPVAVPLVSVNGVGVMCKLVVLNSVVIMH